jgi:hypothetical protein
LDVDGNIIHQKIFGATGDTSFQVARAGIDTLANIYLILSYIENNSGYISMKLDSSLNVLDTKIWPSNNTNPLIMDHYDRMVYHNGIFYCPATYYVSWIAQYQSFFLVDTLMTQVCGMTMLPSGVSEKNYQSNQTQWNSVTATALTPSSSSYPLVSGTLPGVFDLCLSITTPEIPLRKRVIVSPNPASGLISIDIEEESSYEIHLLNVTGMEVLFQENISNNLLINISQLPAGVYFLNYLSARHSFTEKIIKM